MSNGQDQDAGTEDTSPAEFTDKIIDDPARPGVDPQFDREPATWESGRCLPVIDGAKPKQGRGERLQSLAGATPLPSGLAAGVLHMCRRYLLGVEPANTLERVTFRRLGNATEGFREVLSCAVNALDDLPPGLRDELFDTSLLTDPSQPLTAEALLESFTKELSGRVGGLVFGDEDGLEEEIPGEIRLVDPGDDEFFPTPVRICRLNGLRTRSFRPRLSAGDWLPDEIQHICEIQDIEGTPEVNCEVQTANCPGNSAHGVCLRVPEIAAGDSVVLEGVNFFSTDTVVRLTSQQPTESITRDLSTHVRGDLETPVTETIDGQAFVVMDCRVHDRLTFTIPEDLPPATYEVRVIVPNISGIAFWGESLASDPEYITVELPPTARVEIFSETLHAELDTSPRNLGSDEVGLKFLAAAIPADGTLGLLRNDTPAIRLGNVDSGDTRDVSAQIFTHDQPIAGLAMVILGHEVDSNGAYEQQITEWTEVFGDIIEDQWRLVAGLITAAGGVGAALELAGKMPPWAWIALGAAIVVTLAVDVIVALWAPADPIMKDSIALSAVELAQLTSPAFPMPRRDRYSAGDNINVLREPLEKLPTQYREERRYASAGQFSEYHLTLRFNRVA